MFGHIAQGVPKSLERTWKLRNVYELSELRLQKDGFLRQKIAFWAFFGYLLNENGFFEAISLM